MKAARKLFSRNRALQAEHSPSQRNTGNSIDDYVIPRDPNMGPAGLERSSAVHGKRDADSLPRRGLVQQDKKQQRRSGGNVTKEDIDVYERMPKTFTDRTIASTQSPPRSKSGTKPACPSPLKNVVSSASTSTRNEGGKEKRGQSPPPSREKVGPSGEIRRRPLRSVRDGDVNTTRRDIHSPNAPSSTIDGTSSTQSRSRGVHQPSPLRKSVADPDSPRPTSATEKGRTSQKEPGRPATTRPEEGTTISHQSGVRKASLGAAGGPPNPIKRRGTPHPKAGILNPSSSRSSRSALPPQPIGNAERRSSERPRERSPHARRDLEQRTEMSPTPTQRYAANSKKTLLTGESKFRENLSEAQPRKATSNASGIVSRRTTPDSRSSFPDEDKTSLWERPGKRRAATPKYEKPQRGRKPFQWEVPVEDSGSDFFRERDARERALSESEDYWKVVQ